MYIVQKVMTLNCPTSLITPCYRLIKRKVINKFMRYTYKKERRDPQIQSYETGKGKRWRIKFSMTYNGERHSIERSGFVSFDAAKLGKNKAINDVQKNITKLNITVQEYFEQYCEEKLQNGSWRYTTYARQTSLFKKLFYPRWGKIKMAKVNRGDYQRWLTKMTIEKNYSKKTVQTFNSAIATVFADALLNDVIIKNPIQKIKVSGTASRDTSMTRSEFNRVFDFIKSSPLLKNQERSMALLTTLGLRHEEISGLKLKYIKDNMIGIFEVLNLHGQVTPPKTSSSERWVPMTPLVEEYLKLTINEARDTYGKNGIIMSPDSFIFVNHLARHIRYSKLTEIFQLISKETGIHVWPHKMRHAFSTIAFGIEGLNPKDIANILGHSKIDMSLFYNNGTDEGKKQAMSKISNMF